MILLHIHSLNSLGGRRRFLSLPAALIMTGLAVLCLTSPARAYDPSTGDFSKASETDVRIMSYNTKGDFIYNSDKDESFDNIIRAIGPDIIVFEEFNPSTNPRFKTV